MRNPTRTSVEGDVVTIRHVYDAPRELVFRCLVEPEHLAHFWGPPGITTPADRIVVDLRVGGVFETVMIHDESGAEYPNRGVYTQIVEPELLVWEEPDVGMTMTSTFTDLGDGRCEVVIVQRHVPEAFSTEDALAGMAGSLARFDDYLEDLQEA